MTRYLAGNVSGRLELTGNLKPFIRGSKLSFDLKDI